MKQASLDLSRLQVFPLAARASLTKVEDIVVPPGRPAPTLAPAVAAAVERAAEDIVRARAAKAAVILIYGAHLLRNGAVSLLTEMMQRGWITHLATNGAGTIHDWEYAWLGRSTESVEENVASGTFGAWDETGRNIHLALMAGALQGLGYGRALGRFVVEDGVTIPDEDLLERMITEFPGDPMGAACSDLLAAMRRHGLVSGPVRVEHRWKEASILAQAWRLGVPVSVHPGIGYDIIACHPMFNGAVIGRAAGEDFRLFCGAVEGLDQGVVLSIGSAIMGPQVFEKSLSCVHNLRFQEQRPPVRGHSIHVVDLQDGGGWDWTQGEPPKSNPAYYLRFCKSYSRMGGTMHYVQSDNLQFVHALWHRLQVLARTGQSI